VRTRRYRDRKEFIYFGFALIVSLTIRLALLFCFVALCVSKVWLPTICWTAFFLVVTILAMITRLATIRGNMLRVGNDQFPEIEELVRDLAREIELRRTPEVYITPHSVPSGRVMTSRKCDVLIVSTGLLDLITKGERHAARFLIARELCRLALKHVPMGRWVWGAGLIPFVGSAYARACARSADAAGAACVPQGAIAGLCMIASGPNLLRRVNIETYIEQAEKTRNALSWVAEHLSSTPFLPKRMRNCMKIVG
jgi:Zn-dependent protease with chaperone function